MTFSQHLQVHCKINSGALLDLSGLEVLVGLAHKQVLIISYARRVFLRPWEDLRRVGMRFARGGTNNEVSMSDPWQTSYRLALLKASYFPAGKEMLDQYQYLGNCPPTPPLTQH